VLDVLQRRNVTNLAFLISCLYKSLLNNTAVIFKVGKGEGRKKDGGKGSLLFYIFLYLFFYVAFKWECS